MQNTIKDQAAWEETDQQKKIPSGGETRGRLGPETSNISLWVARVAAVQTSQHVPQMFREVPHVPVPWPAVLWGGALPPFTLTVNVDSSVSVSVAFPTLICRDQSKRWTHNPPRLHQGPGQVRP